MSIISRCLATIHDEIPEEILKAAFVTPYYRESYNPLGIDSRIMDEVINKRVMPDLDITYALTLKIPISECIVTKSGHTSYRIEIPEAATNGRTIVSVLGINSTGQVTFGNYSNMSYASKSIINSEAQKLANANSVPSVDYNAKIQQISPNVFQLRYSAYLPSNATLEIMVGHDKNLSTIPIRAVPYLKDLFLFAVQAYCYRKLSIKIDRAAQEAGADIGAFSTWLESFSDANTMYKELLKDVIQAVAWMADSEGMYNLMEITWGNI